MLWMKLTASPLASIAPSQIVSPGCATCGHGSARLRSMRAASLSRTAAARKSSARSVIDAGSPMMRSRTMKACLVASIRPCTCSKPSASLDAEPLEQRQDHQRRQALRRRREVEQLGALDADRERLAPLRAMGGEVFARDRRLAAREVGGDLPRQLAGVEIHRPLLADPLQRARQRRQLHQLAFARQLAVEEECRNEVRSVLQLRQLRLGQLLLAGGHRKAVLAGPDRVLDQARQRQLAAELRADREHLRPAGQRAGDRVGGKRSALRDRRMAERRVHLARSRPSPRRRRHRRRSAGVPSAQISQKPSPPIEVMCG